jgi:hypothetical protein
MIGSGLTGLIMTLMDGGAAFAAVVLGQPLPDWFSARPWQPWPVCQSVLVIAGGLGGMTGVFTLTAVGTLAGLVFVTPVGLLTVLPSVLLLLAALLRLRAFYEFMPRWRRPGHRPPGPEYR